MQTNTNTSSKRILLDYFGGYIAEDAPQDIKQEIIHVYSTSVWPMASNLRSVDTVNVINSNFFKFLNKPFGFIHCISVVQASCFKTCI